MQLIGISLFGKDRRAVVVAEGLLNTVTVIHKVEHEHIMFLWMCAVEARERLHRFDTGEDLVHIRRVEQRFVITRSEL